MKKLFCLILLGLFIFTGNAETKIYEKAKFEVVQSFDVSSLEFVNVNFDFEAVSFFRESKSFKVSKTDSENFAVIDSVGWCVLKDYSLPTIYKERLNSNYIIDKKELMRSKGIGIKISLS